MKENSRAFLEEAQGNESMAALRRMEEKLELMEKRGRRQHIARVITGLVLLAALALALTVLLPQMKTMAEDYNDAVAVLKEAGAAIEALELEKLNATVDFLSELDYAALQETLEQITEIDVESILDSLKDVNSLIGKLSGLDMQGISESLNKLNELISPLLDKLNRWGLVK